MQKLLPRRLLARIMQEIRIRVDWGLIKNAVAL